MAPPGDGADSWDEVGGDLARIERPVPFGETELSAVHFWEDRGRRRGADRAFPSTTLRDMLAVGFRHQRLIILTFLGILSLTVAYLVLRQPEYKAEMKILVKHGRADEVVSADAQPVADRSRAVSEEELNSEAQLLMSRDLLEKVVRTLGPKAFGSGESLLASLKSVVGLDEPPNEHKQIARLVHDFEQAVEVRLLPRSNVIAVTFVSHDPNFSTRVLQTLSELYLIKHLEVHRPPGALEFFQQETDRYRDGLENTEHKLAGFSRSQGVVSVELEKEITVHKVSDLETLLQTTRAGALATRERIRTLEHQATTLPARRTTAMRTSAGLAERLQENLVTLEMKRIELTNLFQPDYPPVKEVEAQIASTRASLEKAREAPVVEQTTDRDPTYDWVQGELAKARSDLADLEARAADTQKNLDSSRQRAQELDGVDQVRQDLQREAKIAEESYLIYSRKQEEARISEALDQRRILNVAIAEAPTEPLLPSGPQASLILLGGFLFACVFSVASAFVVDYLDPSFRTVEEVEMLLNVPLVVSMPKSELP